MDDITFLANENDYTTFPEGKPKTLVRYSKVRFVCSQCGKEKTILGRYLECCSQRFLAGYTRN